LQSARSSAVKIELKQLSRNWHSSSQCTFSLKTIKQGNIHTKCREEIVKGLNEGVEKKTLLIEENETCTPSFSRRKDLKEVEENLYSML
jgi:hypothetical protein